MTRNEFRRWPLLRAAGMLSILALAGCSSMLGQSGAGNQAAGSAPPVVQAVPAGTDPEDEVIGRREHPRIIAAYGGVYSNRKAEIMVARIVSRLLAAADQPNSNFQVTILDSSEVNAFALPGGYIYVTRGILALANDTSELAAVLAHEIAHVTLRHARARSSRERTTQIVDRVVTDVLGGSVETDQSSQRSRLSMAAFSQQQELEADREGVLISGRAGYDPHAASRFLGAMARFQSYASGENAGDDFLSSHPATPERIQKAVEVARSFGAPGIGETDRATYFAAIDGLTFGESPNKGAVVGQRFIHPGLGFTFTVPEGYALQNSPDAVVAVAGEGEALRFDQAEVAADAGLVDYLQSGWIAGLIPKTIEAHNFNGVEMASGRAQTDDWAFRVAVLRYQNQVYRFIFAAKSDSERFAQGVQQTLQSFRAADQNDTAQIKPVQLNVLVASAGDTADSLAGRMAGLEGGRELFFVINGLYPGDPVTPGAQYKIVSID